MLFMKSLSANTSTNPSRSKGEIEGRASGHKLVWKIGPKNKRVDEPCLYAIQNSQGSRLMALKNRRPSRRSKLAKNVVRLVRNESPGREHARSRGPAARSLHQNGHRPRHHEHHARRHHCHRHHCQHQCSHLQHLEVAHTAPAMHCDHA